MTVEKGSRGAVKEGPKCYISGRAVDYTTPHAHTDHGFVFGTHLCERFCSLPHFPFDNSATLHWWSFACLPAAFPACLNPRRLTFSLTCC